MPRPRPPSHQKHQRQQPPPPPNWPTLLTKAHLSTLPSASKRHLLSTLAQEISSVFIRVSELTRSNVLSARHTGPIEDVIGLIAGVEKEHRLGLERRLRRAERREMRRAKRWREERRWMRKCYAMLLRKAMEVNAKWRERVEFLEEARGREAGTSSFS